MACALRIISNNFLLRKTLSCEQTVIKIQKYAMSRTRKVYIDYVKLSKILQTMSSFLNAEHVTQDLCLSVRNDMINKHVIPEDTVDIKILDICLKQNKVQIAKEYINYLQNNGYSINLYTFARYLELYQKEIPTSIYEKNEIINICTKIKKEWKYIPYSVKKNCIVALCRTHKWEMALEFLEDTIENANNTKSITSYIIPAAFRNKNASRGLELLQKTNNFHMDGHRMVAFYQEYLNYFLRNEQSELNTAISNIFFLWRKYNIIPIKYIADLFVNAYHTMEWDATYITINRNGYCCGCGNYLIDMTISDEDFKVLAHYIVNKILVGDDIFRSTTPDEFYEFKCFIQHTKPYDIVIDGLNIFHSSSLDQVIDSFSIDKKILIIARRHLRKLMSKIMRLDNVHIYYLEDNTQDDPFVLYATLISGNNAKFVTLDLLREHIHKLVNEKIRKMFQRWQYTHQYVCECDEKTGKVTLIPPWLYEPFAQCNDEYWHIPYRMNTEKSKLLFQPVNTWVCFHNPPK